MDPITLALIGAGIGVGKGILIDGPKESRQRELNAELTRYSPWTGFDFQKGMAGIQSSDPVGQGLAFGALGHQFGMKNQAAAAGPWTAAAASETPVGAPAPIKNPYSLGTDYNSYFENLYGRQNKNNWGRLASQE